MNHFIDNVMSILIKDGAKGDRAMSALKTFLAKHPEAPAYVTPLEVAEQIAIPAGI